VREESAPRRLHAVTKVGRREALSPEIIISRYREAQPRGTRFDAPLERDKSMCHDQIATFACFKPINTTTSCRVSNLFHKIGHFAVS
jgi:hypothetical protein